MHQKPFEPDGVKGRRHVRFAVIAPIAALATVLAAQNPPIVDTSRIGPQVGAVVPAFSGIDQFGRTQALESVLGEKGAMLVFFRSADW